MLRLKNISHKYDQSWVLQDVSFDFGSKKYVLLGPSGIGKSTLLHIANSIIKPVSGSVQSDEEIAIIFQNCNLLTDFTIRENVEIAAKIKKKKAGYAELAKLIGIEDILDRYPNQISGGQKQRAAIMLALALGATFILADEPTGDLDNENAKIVRSLFGLLHEKLNVGFLVSTHDAAWLTLADEILQIENKKLRSYQPDAYLRSQGMKK